MSGFTEYAALNHGPEIFILRDFISREMRDRIGRGLEVGCMRLVEETIHGERTGQSGCLAKEVTAIAKEHIQHCRRSLALKSTYL